MSGKVIERELTNNQSIHWNIFQPQKNNSDESVIKKRSRNERTPESTPIKDPKKQALNWSNKTPPPKQLFSYEGPYSPIRPKNLASLEKNPSFKKSPILRSPKKNIKESPQKLKDLIFNLIKELGLNKGKNKLSNLLKNYENSKPNNKPIEYQPILPPFNSLESYGINLTKKKAKMSGAHATVSILTNRNDIVLKEFKQIDGVSKIEVLELYGGFLNYKFQTQIPQEFKNNFNKISQMYVKRQKQPKETILIILLEKANIGDLIDLSGHFPQITDINFKCKIFHKISIDCVMILYSFIILEYVSRDIKPDNILCNQNENGEIQCQISDFSTCVKVNTPVDNFIGTDSYIGQLFASVLDKMGRVRIKYSFDWYSMALTLFNIFGVLFSKNVIFQDNNTGIYTTFSQYFPFTNDNSTIPSKIDSCSSQEKYDYQVELLDSFLIQSLESISQIHGITQDSIDNLKKDIEIMKKLFLSNNPFEDKTNYTIEEIKIYLGIP
jgi:hypothetical protein